MVGEDVQVLLLCYFILCYFILWDIIVYRIYIGFALGEVIAMIFIPLVFLSLYDLTERQHSKKGLLCIMFLCLMLSHTISFVLCFLLAVIWCIARYKKILQNKKIIVEILIEAGISMLLTCNYWLPVVEQFAEDVFHVSTNPAWLNHENTMNILEIVCGEHSIAFIEVGLLLFMILLGKLKNVCDRKVIWCLGCIAIFLVIETDIFPWKLIDKTPFVSIQFPWRLNMMSEFILAVGLAMQLFTVFGLYMNERKRVVFCVVIGILIGIFNLSIVCSSELGSYVNYPEGYADIEKNTNSVGCMEWLPADGNISDAIYSEYKGMVRCGDMYLNGNYNADGTFEFYPDGIRGECVVPKYYYKGYVAECIDIDGVIHEKMVQKSAMGGFVKIDVDSNIERVKVIYNGTRIQKISCIIPLIGLLIFAFGIVK